MSIRPVQIRTLLSFFMIALCAKVMAVDYPCDSYDEYLLINETNGTLFLATPYSSEYSSIPPGKSACLPGDTAKGYIKMDDESDTRIAINAGTITRGSTCRLSGVQSPFRISHSCKEPELPDCSDHPLAYVINGTKNSLSLYPPELVQHPLVEVRPGRGICYTKGESVTQKQDTSETGFIGDVTDTYCWIRNNGLICHPDNTFSY